MLFSRRGFLGSAMALVAGGPAVLGAARQGLDRFTIPSVPCADDTVLTPAVPRDATYRPGAPRRTSLMEAGMTGTHLTLAGTIAGRTCGRIAGAEVEYWQADASGAYDASGFRLRGQQLTDTDGGYRVATIVPGSTRGRAPSIGLRVRVPGKLDFSTAAFLPGDPRNAVDPRFRPGLAMTIAPGSGDKTATFDIVVEL